MGINERYLEDNVACFEQQSPLSDIDTIQTPALLVSMPNLNDPYFQKSVILLLEYTTEHAYGMVINRPSTLKARDILVDAASFKREVEGPLLVGGPVSPEFMWALHSPEYQSPSTTALGRFSISSINEVLLDIAKGLGPATYMLGSGYAGWGPGQLDRELNEGAWWVTQLDADLILEMPYQERWEKLLTSLGIDPYTTTFYATGEA